MGKEQHKPNNVGLKIEKLCFSVSSPNHLRQQSLVQCVNKEFYEDASQTPRGQPASSAPGRRLNRFGVLDPRLGTSSTSNKCETCGQSLSECIGHFGHIDLPLPVYHVGYFRFIQLILQCICKTCSRLLLPSLKRQEYQAKILSSRCRSSYLERKALHNAILVVCKKQHKCSYCGAYNGTVKKTGLYKLLHQPRPSNHRSKSAIKSGIPPEYLNACEGNQELEELLASQNFSFEILSPIKVLSLFERIPDCDVPFLLISDNQRPEYLILERVPVPPACIRPSVCNDDATNEDDLTILLGEINHLSGVIEKRKREGALFSLLLESWDFIQLVMALLINSETSAIPVQMRQKKPTRGLVQRLKGKHGRFRGNLSGKRVDFSSRSVISPNPMLAIDEVGVPQYIAKILTFPAHVNQSNLELMRELVRNGHDKHPGANFVCETKTNRKTFLKFGNRDLVARNLKPGDLVERHLMDGDVVLFNRQPSLHKLSIMCHKARVHLNRTFQFNECVCTPYNADFDGDEMNMHLLQTEEAKAEAYVLMGTKSNIITPRNGEPLIAAIQDFITGAFLLTKKDFFLSKSQAQQLISALLASVDSNITLDFPPPFLIKPVTLWSGKQIFSLLLRPNKNSSAKLNFRGKTKNYSNENEEFCSRDGFVVVRNGQLLAGQLDKSMLGSGSKSNLFYIMLRDFCGDAAGDSLCRLSRMISAFLANHLGFSLGIDDVTPTFELACDKTEVLQTGYERVKSFIKLEKEQKLEAAEGLTCEQTLESIVLRELSSIRDALGRSCLQQLLPTNPALIMAMCGSKGSAINVSQMVACVGQQAIRGQRVPDQYNGRSLPHFEHGEKSPLAKGFVSNSFYSGLTPIEFFFHTMAGREGLLDTAVKTAETGYMQRRLVKALEDLVSHYDGSVRNSRGELIQLKYGDDGLDPAEIDSANKSIDLDHLFKHSLACYLTRTEASLTLNQAKKIMEKVFDCSREWSRVESEFKEKVSEHVCEYLESNPFRKLARRTTRNCPTNELTRLTQTQLIQFLQMAYLKYNKTQMEPGTAVGAICAQSIGEPATQMTLKTFHFAGVASMNITQGVPRIKELINALRNISTPVIKVDLMFPYDREEARRTKMRIESTKLGQICSLVSEVFEPDDCYIELVLDTKRIELLRLDVDAHKISNSISTQLRITMDRIKICTVKDDGENTICVRAANLAETWQLRESLCGIQIKGISSVKKASMRVRETNDKDAPEEMYIVVEGEGLQQVMATYGVAYETAYSNNVLEVAQVLGIEAAREVIIREIRTTMQSHGIGIDERHLKLLADTMTYKGRVLGITRHGLAKMKESSLMLASFERTADHLFEAAYYGQQDPIAGVSESIISGTPMRIGTGFFDLLFKPNNPPDILSRDGTDPQNSLSLAAASATRKFLLA